MPKQIISDTFETLGGMAKSAGQQAASDVKKVGEDIAVELGIKPAQQQSPSDQTSVPAQNEEQPQKIDEAAKRRAQIRYQEIQAEIKGLQDKRSKDLLGRVAEKPSLDEGQKIKQLEAGAASAPPTGGATASQGNKLPPIPVQRATKKAETFRGASG